MKPLKKNISITLDENVYKRAKEQAERLDRSLSSYINMLLSRHLRHLENRDYSKAPAKE